MKLAILQRKIMGKKIEVEKDGITVTVTGDGKLKSISIDGTERKDVTVAVNEAINKAQMWAAGEMKGMMGEIAKIMK